MLTWDDKPYWIIADDIAHKAYRQLFSLIKKRGMNNHSLALPSNMKNYKSKNQTPGQYQQRIGDAFDLYYDVEDQIFVDFTHKIVSDNSIEAPDNFATCCAVDDYCEIDIVTLLPKNYRIKTLIKNKKFKWDFLNVIRHEIEHMFQGCDFKVKAPTAKEHDRSKNNFLLKPCEIPAYVHGFRITTTSGAHFLDTVKQFINTHGRHMKLTEKEINFTTKIWFNYLKNLDYYCKL